MDRNIALEFVRVTEAAAISCSQWMGKGDKIKSDHAAVESMRKALNDIDFDGTVVIGEGEKDEAPMLYSGEKVGKGGEIKIDLAIDPLECTTNLAKGKPNAISVLAAGPKGTLLKAPGTYMDQIVVGKEASGSIDINDTIYNNLERISKALEKDINELTVCILDRERLQSQIDEIRKAGARIKLIEHGTISGGVATAIDNSGIDVLMGYGGAPETVILAAAIKCIGGEIQAKLTPHNEKTKKEAKKLGLSEDTVYNAGDLAKGDNLLFVATGVSDGPFLKGVVFTKTGALTHSVAMKSKSGSIRYIETYHNFNNN